VRGRAAPNLICYLTDTDIVRASERQHSFQGGGNDGDLGRLGLAGPPSKRIADHALVPAEFIVLLSMAAAGAEIGALIEVG
jgi:hypothetical protein